MSASKTSAPQRDLDQAAVWRSAMFRALALSFSYPEPEVAAQLAVDLEALGSHELTLGGAFQPAVDALREALTLTPREELAATHNALFAGEVPCSPYETEYEFDAFAKARQLADIAGFYRAFGLKVATGDAAPADFIATELDFLSHLALKEVYAGLHGWDDRLAVTREAQRSFLQDHIGNWAPLFCRTLVSLDDVDSFYGAAACLTDAMVNAEIERHGISPRPALTRRLAAGQDDTLTCPMAAPAHDEEEVPG